MAGETLAEIRRALARSCMAAFVRHTMPAYRMGWVHEEVCAELDAFLADVVAGRSPRLMLTMPPRHGKSEFASPPMPWAATPISPSFPRATPQTCPRA